MAHFEGKLKHYQRPVSTGLNRSGSHRSLAVFMRSFNFPVLSGPGPVQSRSLAGPRTGPSNTKWKSGGRTDGWTDGRKDRRTERRTDGQKEGWTDGRKDGQKDGDESVSRYARANKNKYKCAGVFDHQELSTNTTISVVRALGLSVRSVRRGTSRHKRNCGGTTNGKLVADTISTCRECNRMDRIKKGERKRERVVDGK